MSLGWGVTPWLRIINTPEELAWKGTLLIARMMGHGHSAAAGTFQSSALLGDITSHQPRSSKDLIQSSGPAKCVHSSVVFPQERVMLLVLLFSRKAAVPQLGHFLLLG